MTTRNITLTIIAALSMMWMTLPANAQHNFGPWSYLLEQPNDQAPHREMMNQQPRERSQEMRQNRWNNQQYQDYPQRERGMNQRGGMMMEPQPQPEQGFRGYPQHRMNRHDEMMGPRYPGEQGFQGPKHQMDQRHQGPDMNQRGQRMNQQPWGRSQEMRQNRWNNQQFQDYPQRERGMNQRQQKMRQQPWEQSEFQGRPQREMRQRGRMMDQQYQEQPELQSRRQRPGMMNQQRPSNQQYRQPSQSYSPMSRQGRFTPARGRDGTVSPQYQAFKRQNLHGASEMTRHNGDTGPKQGRNVRQRGQNDLKSNQNVCPYCGQKFNNYRNPQRQNRQAPANQARFNEQPQKPGNNRNMRPQYQKEKLQQNWGNHFENRRHQQNQPGWPDTAPQDEMNRY